MKKILLIAILIGVAAWLHANHQTAVRLKLSSAYRNGEVELAAIRAIQKGDNIKAINLLESRLETNAYILNYVIDSRFQRRSRRDEAIRFLADYEKYIADKPGKQAISNR